MDAVRTIESREPAADAALDCNKLVQTLCSE
jgi:hypothetical protein